MTLAAATGANNPMGRPTPRSACAPSDSGASADRWQAADSVTRIRQARAVGSGRRGSGAAPHDTGKSTRAIAQTKVTNVTVAVVLIPGARA